MTNQIVSTRAAKVIARCRELARISDAPGETTRLFLSPKTRDAHTLLTWWMRQGGLEARTDDAGNLRAVRRSAKADAPTLVLFSHIDTVPNAGAFDGPLGVLLGLAAIEELGATPLPFHLELIAFSEEEGVRFGFPFLSSLAVTGQLSAEQLARTDSAGISVEQALRDFGLDPDRIAQSCPLTPNTFAALEVHIEQGPVLESDNASLAVVETIVGQSRLNLTFEGQANHAGTTPMPLRHDALAAAAQWIVEVERYASDHTQLVATVGRIEALPGATNVIPGTTHLTLDVRHPKDESRHAAVAHLLTKAEAAGALRGVSVRAKLLAEQKAVPMDRALTVHLHQAAERTGHDAKPMFSGAGHDAMILAPHVPTTMLFVRSPGGLSHHPGESVREEDVEAALATVLNLLVHLKPHAKH
ncbi:allantoate amidohydrolase [Granulicella mallensis]|uniref:Amidase, hydantoinase/carbamoylase family n=1 Tax=Granulicella mallensis (strain ATCC BAA-1857 / DSM 23137 / MP5ACTX8) TaxID=682795 RepID=G8NRV5_GRAMM|nr:allantoate amidohydrolase [Granulicella mallensis]AEU35068.1 amidase, hydantoinase/carbamoylase family [Granulicella mallensis MP5ACTX8]